MNPDPPSLPDAGSRASPLRLDSWKEIAVYLKRDVRTVRRWEAQGLPVHRHLHHSRHSVYAFADELDGWWTNGRPHAGDRPVVFQAPRHAAAMFGGAAIVLALSTGAGLNRVGLERLEGVQLRAAVQPTRDAQAYELYLRGRQSLDRRAGARLAAVPYLERAVARDPAFAQAQAALGEAYLRVAIRAEPAERAQAWLDADAAIRRALALDDTLAIAHATLGWLHLFRDWNWAQARAELLRAVALDPNDPNVRSNYALYLRGAGRMDEAIDQRRHARALDPLRIDLTVWLGNDYVFARRYDEAIASFEQALELEPAYMPALASLADVLERKGLYERAAVAQLKVLKARGNDELAAGFDAAYRRDGYRAAVTWLDRRSIDEFARRSDINAWKLAYTYARLGDREAALRWLDVAFERRADGLFQIRVDPDLDCLRGDPRFEAIIARMGDWP